MKTHPLIARAFAVVAFGLSLATAGAHQEGATKKIAGPNGGRIITTVEPRAEFLVQPDGKVRITFLDKDSKAIAPAAQTVTVTAGERAAPKTLTFARAGNALVSDLALPKGDSVPTVVQIKATAAASVVTEKFNVDLSKCGECKLAEYACICAH
jgi:hypothetical protein